VALAHDVAKYVVALLTSRIIRKVAGSRWSYPPVEFRGRNRAGNVAPCSV
jgi:hypothetical protein